MNELSKSLDEILTYLIRWQFKVPTYLQPPLKVEVIKEKLSRINIEPSDELIEFYSWRNGTSIKENPLIDDIHFFPGYYILSLEDAIEDYLLFEDHPQWSKDWLPIFANGGGDFYAVDLSLQTKKESPLIDFLLGEPEHDIEFSSITNMFKTILECFKQNAIFRTEEGYLERDTSEYIRIAQKLNSDIDYWHNCFCKNLI